MSDDDILDLSDSSDGLDLLDSDQLLDSEPEIEDNMEKSDEMIPDKIADENPVNSQNVGHKKIILNVGGKKFNIKKNQLSYLNIDINKLYKTDSNVDDRQIYFLDKDPQYFTNVIEIIDEVGLDSDQIINCMDEFTEQLLSELCFYSILDNKYKPTPKVKLQKIVGFQSRHDIPIKINIGDKVFETSEGTLAKSPVLNSKMKTSRHNQINLINVDPKIFRYVLFLLRNNELYHLTPEILQTLKKFEIDFVIVKQKKIIESVSSILEVENPYLPNKPSVYNNIINASTVLKFGSIISFDLKKYQVDTINDLSLIIDLPVLKTTEKYEYVDNIAQTLIELLQVSIGDTIILQTNGHYLNIYPTIYQKSNLEAYKQLSQATKKKLLYNDTLIDIQRIILPLSLLKSNPIPISKISTKMDCKLAIKLASIDKIFKNIVKEIPLLNICLFTNMSTIPIKNISEYFYEKTHTLAVPINIIESDIYNVALIPLSKFVLIKDFFFTIHTKESYEDKTFEPSPDELVEFEIIQTKVASIHSKVDSDISNVYTPLRHLGYTLSPGIYYHTFSPDRHISTIGFPGDNLLLQIKIKKMAGYVILHLNEIVKMKFDL